MNFPKEYRLEKDEEIHEIGAHAYLLRHVKSGARVLLMDCVDENKVFNIAFRTAPEDSTGVPHILEHSVLCGSDRYPVKDPFSELDKGSLNTFLNAMTFPDKTTYPVASLNDADFRNLMSVYLDAVLHPAIYHEEKIFRQEGWRYEMTDPEGPVTYNGVVYNEMRGAFSDPEEVVERYLMNSLFPDNCYGNESGGDPKCIPDLSYEDFLAFHKRLYHPSNSYIYLYGNLNFEETLAWMDREYLSAYDAIDPHTEIPYQKPFDAPHREKLVFSVSEEEADLSGILAWARVTGDFRDRKAILAWEVISYALLNAPGAPLKQALLDAGIGTDIFGGHDSAMLQPNFQIVAKGADPKDADRFEKIIRDVLTDAVKNGLRKKSLQAGLHNIEFSLREADYGSMPKGLIYAFSALESWLYDDREPVSPLQYDGVFEELRADIDTGYFEELVRKCLLENPFGVTLVAEPKPGLAKEEDEKLKEKLAAYKAGLTDAEIREIIEKTKELKAYQSEPSSPEALETIPLLSISDIRREPEKLVNEPRNLGGIKTVAHPATTSGILYFDLYFPLTAVKTEDFPYVGLLKKLLGLMSTENYSYQELSEEIDLYTGGIGFASTTGERIDRSVYESFVIRGKCLYGETEKMLSLISEIALRTSFDDTKRMKEIISEVRTEMQDSLISGGSITALNRALSYLSLSGAEDDRLTGLSFFRFLSDIEKNFSKKKKAVIAKLQEVSKQIFNFNEAELSLTCEPEGEAKVSEAAPRFVAEFPNEKIQKAPRDFKPELKNEGIKTASQVQYVVQAANFIDKGYQVCGEMNVLKTILTTDYLYNKLRVLGGAYGTSCVARRDGSFAFTSYRDPNLSESYARYSEIPEYLKNLEISDREMCKYIIGTINGVDTPLQPHAFGTRSYGIYRSGITEEERKRLREGVLNCTADKIRAFAPMVEDLLQTNARCTVGNEHKINENSGEFKTITTLTGEKA